MVKCNSAFFNSLDSIRHDLYLRTLCKVLVTQSVFDIGKLDNGLLIRTRCFQTTYTTKDRSANFKINPQKENIRLNSAVEVHTKAKIQGTRPLYPTPPHLTTQIKLAVFKQLDI